MIKKALLLIDTCRKLRSRQIFYQVYYRIKKGSFLTVNEVNFSISNLSFFYNCIFSKEIVRNDTFSFLNLDHTFQNYIEWNFMDYGKLWNYNLEYFDYLNQEGITVNRKIELIQDFYHFCIVNKRILEPYPVSLRSINIIKFAVREGLDEEKFISYTYQELQFLHANYEYHILGNHLLENCFAMILGGAFFEEESWIIKAKSTLYKELNEQILEDGAHFELSPMYHQIIFYRILELIDWYSTYSNKDEDFLVFLKDKASKMLSWLENISFKIGDIPLFNDSANGITYDTAKLINYANLLSIDSENIPLSNSGYRSYQGINYEIKVDYAQVGASYQPGHSHADALGFILYYKGNPLFVEGGTSTYQIGKQRNYERSSLAHNTVVVNEQNQSQVWGGFRLGKRAISYIERETENSIKGFHDGYVKLVGKVFREFIFNPNEVVIVDSFEKKSGIGKAYFHIKEGVSIERFQKDCLMLSNGVIMRFQNFKDLIIQESTYAEEYNRYKQGLTIVIEFCDTLETKIIMS